MDLTIWLKGRNVYIIPHSSCEGPKLLPKIPVLKKNFKAQVLTNPAKFSMYSREVMFLNVPLMKHMYQKNIFNKEES